jgi:hypothetical protein
VDRGGLLHVEQEFVRRGDRLRLAEGPDAVVVEEEPEANEPLETPDGLSTDS